ncbi:MAG: hypothetical protein LQ349_007520 [Xanthoria aureola]|nr:MAG: hypothetical protein LQ349_007520 [Xanthoria aureola]
MAGNTETTDMTAADRPQVAKAKTTDDVAVEPTRPTITRSFSDPGLSIAATAATAAAAEPALPEEEQGAAAGSDQQQQQQDDLSGYDPIKLPAYDLSATNEDGGGTATGEAGNEVPPPEDLDWLPYMPGGAARGTIVRSLLDPSVWYYVI